MLLNSIYYNKYYYMKYQSNLKCQFSYSTGQLKSATVEKTSHMPHALSITKLKLTAEYYAYSYFSKLNKRYLIIQFELKWNIVYVLIETQEPSQTGRKYPP